MLGYPFGYLNLELFFQDILSLLEEETKLQVADNQKLAVHAGRGAELKGSSFWLPGRWEGVGRCFSDGICLSLSSEKSDHICY